MDKKGAEDMKSEAEKIKEELICYAKLKDVEGVKNYVKDHKEDIEKIINLYGSGNTYISSAYDLSYNKGDFSFAEEYQKILESIKSNALFEDEY